MIINCGQIMKLEKKNVFVAAHHSRCSLSNEIEYFTLGLVSSLIKREKHSFVKI
jgi:hypothetical protein